MAVFRRLYTKSLVLSLLAAGCSKPGPSSTSTTASAVPSAPPAASAAPSSPPPKASAERAIKRDALLAYQKSLSEGRKLAQSKKWTDAIAQFDEALKAKPDDPRALGELGYAAYNAGDLDRARSANARALKAATEPGLRASILFNEGLIDEKKNDKEAARKHYEASLALRPNATVQARLDQLGPAGGCDARFPSRKGLEDCLRKGEADDLASGDESQPVTFRDKGKGPAGLTVIQWGRETTTGRSPFFLLAEGPWGARRVAQLGEDFEPGAFGVHNEARFDRFEPRTAGGRSLVLVWWTQSNYDSNMAGAQADAFEAKNLTVCVAGDAKAEPRCPVTVALEETNETLYPLEIDKNDELWATIEEMKRQNPPSKRTDKATFVIDDDGTFKVKETSGKRPHLAPYVRGVKLFLPPRRPDRRRPPGARGQEQRRGRPMRPPPAPLKPIRAGHRTWGLARRIMATSMRRRGFLRGVIAASVACAGLALGCGDGGGDEDSSGASGAAGASGAVSAGPPALRKSAAAMSPDEIDRFQRAFSYAVAQGFFDPFNDQHFNHHQQRHHGADVLATSPMTVQIMATAWGHRLLPWHRSFLIEAEKMLRAALRKRNAEEGKNPAEADLLFIPYWDAAHDQKLPPWVVDFLPKGGTAPVPPDLPTSHAGYGKQQGDRYEIVLGRWPGKNDTFDTLQTPDYVGRILAKPTFAEFYDALDGTPEVVMTNFARAQAGLGALEARLPENASVKRVKEAFSAPPSGATEASEAAATTNALFDIGYLAAVESRKPSPDAALIASVKDVYSLFNFMPHLRMHLWAGGLNPADASLRGTVTYFQELAVDPVFWMIHCELDRYWYTWETTHDEQPPLSGDDTLFYPVHSGEGAWYGGGEIHRLERLTDHDALPYRYDALFAP